MKDADLTYDCPFGEWGEGMREYAADNLEVFRKGGKYRLHLDKNVFRGTEVRVVDVLWSYVLRYFGALVRFLSRYCCTCGGAVLFCLVSSVV